MKRMKGLLLPTHHRLEACFHLILMAEQHHQQQLRLQPPYIQMRAHILYIKNEKHASLYQQCQLTGCFTFFFLFWSYHTIMGETYKFQFGPFSHYFLFSAIIFFGLGQGNSTFSFFSLSIESAFIHQLELVHLLSFATTSLL